MSEHPNVTGSGQNQRERIAGGAGEQQVATPNFGCAVDFAMQASLGRHAGTKHLAGRRLHVRTHDSRIRSRG